MVEQSNITTYVNDQIDKLSFIPESTDISDGMAENVEEASHAERVEGFVADSEEEKSLESSRNWLT